MATRSTELLRTVHAHPGITRAAAARTVGVGTGAATEIVARLAQARLVAEVPAAPTGTRGRPTTALVPHPDGPLVLAVGITGETWRVDVVELGGSVVGTSTGAHAGSRWSQVASALTTTLAGVRDTYGGRVRALGVSGPGTVSPDHRLDAATLDWRDADLRELWPAAPVLVTGNDATLAASAESRQGAAVGAAVALHLRVEAGLGGGVVDHGRVLLGATGAAGEFGHMPFGDPAVVCPCGARACWGTAVDGTALARLLGRPAPRDQVAFARRVLAASATDAEAHEAVLTVARALGRGVAGLVNGIDADLVTLGGLGADLLAAAGSEIGAAYTAGLMAHRRADPPRVVPAALGEDGPVLGAAGEAWSALLATLG